MEGNTALGASSPAKPALHIPEPLSMTRAATSSSHMIERGVKFCYLIERGKSVLYAAVCTELYPVAATQWLWTESKPACPLLSWLSALFPYMVISLVDHSASSGKNSARNVNITIYGQSRSISLAVSFDSLATGRGTLEENAGLGVGVTTENLYGNLHWSSFVIICRRRQTIARSFLLPRYFHFSRTSPPAKWMFTPRPLFLLASTRIVMWQSTIYMIYSVRKDVFTHPHTVIDTWLYSVLG